MRGDYSNGRIYFVEPICDHEENEVYYDSTLQKLCKRMDFHRGSYKAWKNGNSGKCMCYELFEKYGVETCKIYLVELYPCKSREELEAREGYYIRNYNCNNKNIAGRTKKEYRKEYCIDNKDEIKEYHKEYHKLNKDKLVQCQKEYRNNNKEYMKEYYNKNKDKIIERKNIYQELNKEKLSTKHNCDCGGVYTYNNKLNHFKTKKHIKYIEQQNEEVWSYINS